MKKVKNQWSSSMGVPIRNMNQHAKQGQFDSEEDIIEAINFCKQQLDKAQDRIIELHHKAHSCNHEYGTSSSRSQEMWSCWVVNYERECNLCGYKDKVSIEHGSDEEPPEWAK